MVVGELNYWEVAGYFALFKKEILNLKFGDSTHTLSV